MLQGKYATKQSEARYPTLWSGLVAAFCPSVTGPTGLRLLNFGRGGDGTLTNMDAPTDWVRSQGQYCLDFDGTNDYVSVSSKPFEDNTRGAVSFWYKSNDLANYGSLVNLSTSGSTSSEFRIDFRGDDNDRIQVTVFNNPTISYTGFSTRSLSDTNWHHVVVVSNGSTLSVYLDGRVDTMASTGGSGTNSGQWFGSATNANQMTIGCLRRASNLLFLNGCVDDVRVYNRALSASEIALLARRRGIAFEPIPRHRRLISRIVDPQPTAATESTGFVFDRRLKLFKGQYAVTKQAAAFPNLWEGCVAAYAPCITGATGLKLFDFARGNTGTLTNMDSANDWPRSQGRYCLDFDGVNDYVETTASFNTDTISISCWFRRKASAPASNGGIVAKWIGNPTTNRSWQLYYAATTNYYGFAISTTGSYQASNDLASTTASRLNEWDHIVCVLTPGVSQKIYVNGSLVAEKTSSVATSIYATTKPIRIGTSFYETVNSDTLANAQIDDIRIYNRVLQPSEIKTLSLSRGIAYRPRQKRIMPHYVTFPAETFTGPYIHVKRTKLLAGKYAIRKEDAKFPQLFEGRVGAWCPSIQGPCGTKVWDWARGSTGTIEATTMTWDRDEGRYALDNYNQGTGSNTGYSRVLCGDGPQFNFKANSISLVGWCKYMSATKAGRIFASQHSSGSAVLMRIGMDATGVTMAQLWTDAGAFRQALGTTDISTGQWFHIALVSSPNGFYTYVNGKIESTLSALTGTCSFGSSGGEMTLGAYSAPTLNNAWPGRFDDIAIYNRPITHQEVILLSRSRGIAYTPKQKQYQPHNFAAVAATMSRLLMLRRKRALQCY